MDGLNDYRFSIFTAPDRSNKKSSRKDLEKLFKTVKAAKKAVYTEPVRVPRTIASSLHKLLGVKDAIDRVRYIKPLPYPATQIPLRVPAKSKFARVKDSFVKRLRTIIVPPPDHLKYLDGDSTTAIEPKPSIKLIDNTNLNQSNSELNLFWFHRSTTRSHSIISSTEHGLKIIKRVVINGNIARVIPTNLMVTARSLKAPISQTVPDTIQIPKPATSNKIPPNSLRPPQPLAGNKLQTHHVNSTTQVTSTAPPTQPVIVKQGLALLPTSGLVLDRPTGQEEAPPTQALPTETAPMTIKLEYPHTDQNPDKVNPAPVVLNPPITPVSIAPVQETPDGHTVGPEADSDDDTPLVQRMSRIEAQRSETEMVDGGEKTDTKKIKKQRKSGVDFTYKTKKSNRWQPRKRNSAHRRSHDPRYALKLAEVRLTKLTTKDLLKWQTSAGYGKVQRDK